MAGETFPVLDPGLQVSFHYRLQIIRKRYLAEALAETIGTLDIRAVDDELSGYVDAVALRRTASLGSRGELLFPVPVVLRANPFLLGYYRLLYGMSQKELYNKGPFGRFKVLEDEGKIPDRIAPLVVPLCQSLIGTGESLVRAIDQLSPSVLHELQLLTVGPQLRGSENTRIGQSATKEVRDLIRRLVAPYVTEATDRTIILRNESGRIVLIEFFADPDIQITEQLPSAIRPTLSVEIKGGGDASNIHNRLGEAEKSHQKARNRGFFEFWTLLRVDLPEQAARRDSPTTSRFFNLDRIRKVKTSDHKEFKDLLSSLIGIKAVP